MTQPALWPQPAQTKLHPDPDRLALHAAGQLRPIERAVIEAHLDFCPWCVEQLREMLEPGGRWLEEVTEVPVGAAVWERLERRLDHPPADPVAAAFPDAGVPGALLPAAALEELGVHRLPTLAWRTVPTTRARFAVLATDQEADMDLVLVGLEPGRRFPKHVHLGNEEVVILAGAYTDEYAHLAAGDYYHYPPGSEHGTLIDAGEPCWTLGLLEHGIMFRGVLGALQWMLDAQTRERWRRFRRQSIAAARGRAVLGAEDD
jgi:putative transcriptional regulator